MHNVDILFNSKQIIFIQHEEAKTARQRSLPAPLGGHHELAFLWDDIPPFSTLHYRLVAVQHVRGVCYLRAFEQFVIRSHFPLCDQILLEGVESLGHQNVADRVSEFCHLQLNFCITFLLLL